jgi:hypothetical protein
MDRFVLDDVVDGLYVALTRWPGDLDTLDSDDIRTMLLEALREADAVIVPTDADAGGEEDE